MLVILLTILGVTVASKINPSFHKRLKNHPNSVWWTIFGIGFLISLGFSLLDMDGSWIADQVISLLAAQLIAFPVPIIYGLSQKKSRSNPKPLHTEENGFSIPSTVKGRTKIVEKCNTEYDLNLKSEEIKKIVEGSFVNKSWEREIASMARPYNNIVEWYSGENSWLRIYMKVFNIQEITSDFGMQYEIVLTSFENIFSYVDQVEVKSIEECIREVNAAYFTNFDDVTFMLTYRFLEKTGRKYKLPMGHVLHAKDPAEDIVSRYL